MEWMPYVHDALEYIENNLLTIENSSEVASHLNMSEIYLQKGFQVMTGYTVAEYIRNRRLYQAALEIMNTDKKLVDIGLKYGFDSPDSFSRAFSRFHGINPSDMRKTKKECHKFLPLKVEIQVKGGNKNTSKTIKKYSFKVIGCKKEINTDFENEELDAFKSQVYDRYDEGKNIDADEFSYAMEKNNIGEFGIRKYINEKSFEYMIAGRYVGGDIPEGMCVEEIPESEWVIVDYYDAAEGLITSIEDAKKQVSDEKDISDKIVIEWYETPDRDKIGFRSALWFQIAQKKEKKRNGLLKFIIIGSIGILLLIGASILGILLYKNSTDKNDTAGKNITIFDESEQLYSSRDVGSAYPEKVPAMHWLDYNGVRYNSVDIAYGYPVFWPSLAREFSYYVDKIEDYTITPVLAEIGEKIGEYMVYPTDDIPEYSDVLSGETAVLCQVYEITEVDKGFAVAVKRKDDVDKYQVFYNQSYNPQELHSFLESIRFDSLHYLYGACFYDDDGNPEKSGEVTRGIDAYGMEKEIELTLSFEIDEKDFSLLLSQDTIPVAENVDGRSTISVTQLGKPLLRIELEYFLIAQWYYVDVYEGGYIATNIGDIKRYFYVGTEATRSFIKKMKTNKTLHLFWKEWNAGRKERLGIKK